MRKMMTNENPKKTDLKSLGVYPCTSSILVPGTSKNEIFDQDRW